MKYSPKRKEASSRLRKGNTPGIFGDTILCPNYWTVTGALSQKAVQIIELSLKN